MPTQRQIHANRLNAQKSTGPKSPEGKAASSANALKSGIDAKSQVIRGEKAAGLEALSAEYHARYRPSTPEARFLVDTLIDCEWLLRRFRRIEAELFEYEVTHAFQLDENSPAAHAFRNAGKILDRLQRRIDSAHRNYRRALADLRTLQTEPASPTPEPPPQPASPPPQPVHPKPTFPILASFRQSAPVSPNPTQPHAASDPNLPQTDPSQLVAPAPPNPTLPRAASDSRPPAA